MKKTGPNGALLTAALMVCLSMAAHGQTMPADTTHSFKIEKGSLEQALNRLADQAGLQVIFDSSLVQGKLAAGFNSTASPRIALDSLLRGTGLVYQFTDETMVVIKRAAAAKISMASAADKKNKEEGVSEMTVEDSRINPFTGVNADLPRTVDDVQPYTIFDSETLQRSGAANLEEFLKRRLTMNTNAQTNAALGGGSQEGNVYGNTSAINLRGLGTDKTLILVNGRRVAGVTLARSNLLVEQQPDLNGIALSAVDRVEVLPSSASGIYGGSAIGGVVNIILKRSYAGGEIKAGYDAAVDDSAPRRSLSATYGRTLEQGRTHLMLIGHWSDAKSLLLRDRVSEYEKNIARAESNSPGFTRVAASPPLGVTPNIGNTVRVPGSSPFAPAPLVFDDGTPLGYGITHLTSGTAPTLSDEDLKAQLLTNAGAYQLGFPNSTQAPSGLRRRLEAEPTVQSFQASLRRQMHPALEMFLDMTLSKNKTDSVYNPFYSDVTVPADAPSNPFDTDIRVMIPSTDELQTRTSSEVRGIVLGATARLPAGWTAQLDYSWSESRYHYSYYHFNAAALTADLTSGALDPFVDTVLYPLAFAEYAAPTTYAGSSTLNDLALRAAGPLFALPWGRPRLAAGLEHRIARKPANKWVLDLPRDTEGSYELTYLPRKQVTDSLYAEAGVPLVKEDRVFLLRQLELQVSGRIERFTVDTGTQQIFNLYKMTPPVIFYEGGTTLDGGLHFSEATYRSNDQTIGLKYRPFASLILRGSVATAFIPPTPEQLLKNPFTNPFPEDIQDPQNPELGEYPVDTQGGGNPDLNPQSSDSLNVGLIWEPSTPALKGLRANIEYYRITQTDAIDRLSAQQIVNLESYFPGRVTRGADGRITLVDRSMLNLYRRETKGWDFSVEYGLQTSLGNFNLRLAESVISSLSNQFSLLMPEYEAAGYSPFEGGAPKYKGSASLVWERNRWSAGWAASYVGSYKQYGAAGGPESIRFNEGAANDIYIRGQGSETISSQSSHDVFVGYRVEARPASMSWLSGLNVQAGVRNLFDTPPSFDAANRYMYYLSPYGDLRMRSFWLNLTKTFD